MIWSILSCAKEYSNCQSTASRAPQVLNFIWHNWAVQLICTIDRCPVVGKIDTTNLLENGGRTVNVARSRLTVCGEILAERLKVFGMLGCMNLGHACAAMPIESRSPVPA